MAQRRPSRNRSKSAKSRPSRRTGKATGVRVIGGALRGRTIDFSPDPKTRPMKDRTREAVFNLIGKPDPDTLVVDLFAGTGAMAFESLSRGAGSAICLERHRPTAARIEAAAEKLGVAERLRVFSVDAFQWWNRHGSESQLLDPSRPWWVFLCPPYDLVIERGEVFDELVQRVMASAPPESFIVIETDERFDVDRLPEGDWDVRSYPPARVAVAEVGEE